MAGFIKNRVIKTKNTLSDWMGINILVDMFKMSKNIFIAVFMPGKGVKPIHETYEEAVVRLKLSEADLEERKKMFMTQMILYLCAGFAVLGYAVWLAFHGYFTAMGIAFLVALLSMSYAFRSHFWLFQMRQKKLGCTFKEYLDSSL
ncbi:MAG: type IVB secretion system protein IcmV [Gammaproteobacteria bacterium]